jgi:glutaminase
MRSKVDEDIMSMTNPVSSFAVAVCTVDGQQFSFGDNTLTFPIMETVMPILYALSLKDCGKTETHKVCCRLLVTCWRDVT